MSALLPKADLCSASAQASQPLRQPRGWRGTGRKVRQGRCVMTLPYCRVCSDFPRNARSPRTPSVLAGPTISANLKGQSVANEPRCATTRAASAWRCREFHRCVRCSPMACGLPAAL